MATDEDQLNDEIAHLEAELEKARLESQLKHLQAQLGAVEAGEDHEIVEEWEDEEEYEEYSEEEMVEEEYEEVYEEGTPDHSLASVICCVHSRQSS